MSPAGGTPKRCPRPTCGRPGPATRRRSGIMRSSRRVVPQGREMRKPNQAALTAAVSLLASGSDTSGVAPARGLPFRRAGAAVSVRDTGALLVVRGDNAATGPLPLRNSRALASLALSRRGGVAAPYPRPVPAGRKPELVGQRVVVIGGSAGIGVETAPARSEGADVIVTGIRSADFTAGEIGARRTRVVRGIPLNGTVGHAGSISGSTSSRALHSALGLSSGEYARMVERPFWPAPKKAQ